MYNFLDAKLFPKVKCDAPSTENFEATNLISEKDVIRSRGFLAYTITKPPVELVFEFLCYVDIHFICLQTTIGRQKCTGIELHAKKDVEPYICIGRATYDRSGITFCTSRSYSKNNPPPGHDPNNELSFFRRDTHKIFRNANFIKVVIFRTDHSVPCLSSVRVFGKPSKNCSEVTIDTINKLMNSVPQTELQINKKSKPNDLKIPEDFIDALTYEIMTIPMTLPSGKSIDRDTLEKHIDNEKSFGRKPCDPFTGLKFTETRKPVMNVSLKSRIDMFLMQNSTNPITYGLKRTLGREESSSKRHRCNNLENYRCCTCEKNELLYILPCKHYYCRQCLISLKMSICNSCKREFSRNSAIRCHFSNF